MKPFELTTVPLAGWNLLEANAGTGKTFSICGLYLRLMLERSCHHDQILTITFTRAAVAELKTRLLDTLINARRWLTLGAGDAWPEDDPVARICQPYHGDAERLALITRALASFDLAPVLTIHSFCQRVLTDVSFATGFDPDAELLELAEPVIEDLTARAWQEEAEGLTPNVLSQMPEVRVEDLVRQITSLFNRPYARLEYPTVDGGELVAAVAQLEDARERVTQAWRDDGEAALALIAEAKAKDHFHKNRFSIQHQQQNRQALFQCLNGLAVKPGAHLRRLGRSFIEQNTRAPFKPGPQHPFFDAVEELEAAAVRLTDTAAGFRAGLAPRLRHRVEKAFADWKSARGRVTFDDLVQHLLRALRDARQAPAIVRECGRQYRAVLIDEYQDTDPLQAEIFDLLFRAGDQPVWRVGDPKQALYGFRGADLHAYLRARENSDARYSLTTDWRAHPDLVAALNALHRVHETPFVLPELNFREARPAGARPGLQLRVDGALEPVLTTWNPEQADVPRAAAQSARVVGRLLNAAERGEAWLEQGEERRPLEADDIVVLVRKHRHGEAMAQALLAQGVRCVRPGVGSVFGTVQALELEQLLHGVCHLERPGRMGGALATALVGAGPEELYQLTRDEQRADTWRDRFRDWRQIWVEQGVEALLVAVLRETRAADRLLTQDEGSSWLARWFHLIELLGSAAGEARLTIYEQLAWLNAQRLNSEFNEAHLVRLDTARNAVRVLTYHVAKGLQFPVVVCPFLWDAVDRATGEAAYHDGEGHLVITFGAGKDDRARIRARTESVSENVRLNYVALTRAQACLYFPWQSVSASRWSGLRQILNPPRDYAGGDYGDGLKGAPGDEAHTAAELALLKSAGAQVLGQPPAPVAPLQPDLTPGHHRSPVPVRARWSVSSYSSLFGGAGSARDTDPDVPDSAEAQEPGWSIHHLPRGPATGLLVHELLEELPPGEPHEPRDGEAGTGSDAAALTAFSRPFLTRYGVDDRFAPALGEALERLLQTPLGPAQLRLSAAGEQQRVVEMEFHLPVGELIVNRFWRVLRDETPPAGLAATVTGFLRGFIDLVVESEGRYWVIDYKSNWLGPSAGSYGPQMLVQNVRQHRYDLQYHLYTVALHRYLQQQQPGYAYEAHFGGVLYLYLRGLQQPDGHGVYWDRPAAETIEKLSSMIFM